MSDFVKNFPEFDPWEVVLRGTPALVRGFHARMDVLRDAPFSKFYAPARKAEADKARVEQKKRESEPDFDREAYEFEQCELAEKQREEDQLEFYGYTTTDRRIDDVNDSVRMLRHIVRRFMAGDKADEVGPFIGVHRPGREIKHPYELDGSLMDDDPETLAAQFGQPE